MSENYRYVKAWRQRSKERLVKAFGGKCINCSYSKCIQSLDFHHLNASDKNFSISSWDTLSWESLLDEVRKCILVCANCHREIHYGVLSIETLNQEIDENILCYKFSSLTFPDTKCETCGKLKSHRRKFCSIKCSNDKARPRADWAKINLEILLLTETYESIGRKLGVTGAAVKKRAKKLGYLS